jgi:prophage DNA circulation protein
MLAPLETRGLTDALITSDLQQRPPNIPQTYVVGAAGAYALATLLLLRFFGQQDSSRVSCWQA